MPKIVIAEDDQLINASLVQGFTDAGYEVISAPDGEEAVAKIKETKPEVVVLDIMMPKLDGIGVLWEMKADPATEKIPAVMLTNLSDAETVSKILEAGAADYLLKSDQSIEQVVQKVREVLERSVKL